MSGIKHTKTVVTAGAASGVLPFTGIAFGVYVAIALMLIVAGIMLRVVGRERV